MLSRGIREQVWVDRVAIVGPGSAPLHTAAVAVGGCVTLVSVVSVAVHVGPVELVVFSGIGEDGVELDFSMVSGCRESRP